MKIKEYKTIHGTNLNILDERINESIKLGFFPIGGPVFNTEIENAYPENKENNNLGIELCSGFTQAIVKYKEEIKHQYYGFGHPPENVASSHPDILKLKERKISNINYNYFGIEEEMNDYISSKKINGFEIISIYKDVFSDVSKLYWNFLVIVVKYES